MCCLHKITHNDSSREEGPSAPPSSQLRPPTHSCGVGVSSPAPASNAGNGQAGRVCVCGGGGFHLLRIGRQNSCLRPPTRQVHGGGGASCQGKRGCVLFHSRAQPRTPPCGGGAGEEAGVGKGGRLGRGGEREEEPGGEKNQARTGTSGRARQAAGASPPHTRHPRTKKGGGRGRGRAGTGGGAPPCVTAAQVPLTRAGGVGKVLGAVPPGPALSLSWGTLLGAQTWSPSRIQIHSLPPFPAGEGVPVSHLLCRRNT